MCVVYYMIRYKIKYKLDMQWLLLRFFIRVNCGYKNGSVVSTFAGVLMVRFVASNWCCFVKHSGVVLATYSVCMEISLTLIELGFNSE